MAIEMVRDGSVWAPRKVLSRLLDRQPGGTRAATERPKFTSRESRSPQACSSARRQPNREIALSLSIDEGTVKAHMRAA